MSIRITSCQMKHLPPFTIFSLFSICRFSPIGDARIYPSTFVRSVARSGSVGGDVYILGIITLLIYIYIYIYIYISSTSHKMVFVPLIVSYRHMLQCVGACRLALEASAVTKPRRLVALHIRAAYLTFTNYTTHPYTATLYAPRLQTPFYIWSPAKYVGLRVPAMMSCRISSENRTRLGIVRRGCWDQKSVV
jgi:hypothetical protein